MSIRLLTEKVDSNNFLSYEESFLKLSSKGDDAIWIVDHPTVIYQTFYCSANIFDRDYAESINLPLRRTAMFDGNRNSAPVLGNGFGILSAIDKLYFSDIEDFVNKFYFSLWKYVSLSFGVELEEKNNDLCILGSDRKIFGMITKETENKYLAHCMFGVETFKNIDFNVLYHLPEEKFEDKNVKTPNDRITSLENETGKKIIKKDIESKILEYLDTINFDFKPSRFSKEEIALANQLKKKHNSQEWTKYGQQEFPDFV